MKLNNLLNVNKALHLAKVVSIASICIAAISVIGALYFVTQYKEKVYVVSPDKTMVAFSRFDDTYLSHEVNNHIKFWYQLFHSFNEATFKPNMDKALPMMGYSGQLEYKRLVNEGIISYLANNDVSVTINIDTMIVDMEAVPIVAYVYGTQSWERGNIIKKNRKDVAFTVEVLQWRSDENPHGLWIDNYRIFNEETMKDE